jgi:hypothetical protein
MQTLDGHCNHLHIKFNTPIRVTEETELGENTRPATQANPGDNGSNPPAGCPKVITAPKVQIDTKKMYDTLKKVSKLSDSAISGIMSNMYSESMFIPEAYNNDAGGCGAYGLVQWRGDRQKKLFKYSNYNSLAINSVDAQVQYLNLELNGTFKYTLAALKTHGGTPENAAKIFHQTYELTTFGTTDFSVNEVLNGQLTVNGKAITTPKIRIDRANEFYKMIKSGNFKLPTA